MDDTRIERRHLLGLSIAAVASSCASSPSVAESGAGEEDVGPAEDLMREHGVLNRILLVYEECRRRLDVAGQPDPCATLVDAAQLVKRFVHDYHEELEEREVFPRLESAGKLADVTHVLREHHAAGRIVTARILTLGGRGAALAQPERSELSSRIADFVRMYRPHEAREDTIVFPAFHALFTPVEWDKLGERFEGREKDALGEEGFEHAVARVAEFERTLEIHDLARFTPRV